MNEQNAICAYHRRPDRVVACRWDGSEEGAENVRKFVEHRDAAAHLVPADFPRVDVDGTWHEGRWPSITVTQNSQQVRHLTAGQWLVYRETPLTREFVVMDDDRFVAKYHLLAGWR